MSAFMVEDKTINRIVGYLRREVYKSSFLKGKAEKAFGISIDKDGWAEAVGKAMFQLNVDGVNERYGTNEAEKFRPLNYSYAPAPATTIYNQSTKIQVLKSLQCWLYQCCEGEVIKNPLYIFFDTVVRPHLMDDIIRDLPEYNNSEWS